MGEKLKEITGEQFKKQVIELDNVNYTDCSFTSCEFVYRGGIFEFNNNILKRCKWSFKNEAANTLRSLSILYQASDQTREVIKNTLDLIQQNKY